MKSVFLATGAALLVCASRAAPAADTALSSEVVDGRVIVTLRNPPGEPAAFVDRVEIPVFLKKRGNNYVATESRTMPVGRELVESMSFDVGSVEQVFDGGGTEKESSVRAGLVGLNDELRRSGGIAGFCQHRWTPLKVYLTRAYGSQEIITSLPTSFCRLDSRDDD